MSKNAPQMILSNMCSIAYHYALTLQDKAEYSQLLHLLTSQPSRLSNVIHMVLPEDPALPGEIMLRVGWHVAWNIGLQFKCIDVGTGTTIDSTLARAHPHDY